MKIPARKPYDSDVTDAREENGGRKRKKTWTGPVLDVAGPFGNLSGCPEPRVWRLAE